MTETIKEIQELIKKNKTHDLKKKLDKYKEIDTNEILHFAVQQEEIDKKTVKTIISAGANVNFPDKKNITPLHHACKNRKGDHLIEILLESGAKAQVGDSFNSTPLHYLCTNQPSLENVKLLLKSKAHADSQNINNLAPLHLACQYNAGVKVIKHLISLYPKQNFQSTINQSTTSNSTPLHFACSADPPDIDVIKYLTSKGANLHSVNSDGKTPFSILCEKADLNSKLLKVLISSGANINVKDSQSNTPLHSLCIKGAPQKVIQLLLDSGVDVNVKNSFGNSPLHEACVHFIRKDVIQSLIDSGANVKLKNNFFETPLHLACRFGASFDVVKLLVDSNAPLNYIDKSFSTPLHEACKRENYEDVIKYLIAAKGDLNYRDLKRPIDYTDSQEIHKWFLYYNSLSQDFLTLLETKTFTDTEVICKNGKIPAHKLILKLRTNDNLFKLHEMAKITPLNEMEVFLKFLYSGLIDDRNYEKNSQIVKQLSNKLGYDYRTKKGQRGLLRDLKKLYLDDKSKDFVISSNSKEIKVHKIILIARSQLFKSIFEQAKNDQKVEDKSKKSFEVVQALIHFLYLDAFESDLSTKALSELTDAHLYYKLNQNSWFPFALQVLKESKN
ncbi:ankyrin repeat protein [Anaeramoeba ignava]|uniref:Ankyrin repeat protein n=1 Tax=Anaeramoeba ignava TaxID=1746090 RepID=A0A9Q0LB94_ANAIG|nr:ankyrin repeat protein [Anaeramoeba ignava]